MLRDTVTPIEATAGSTSAQLLPGSADLDVRLLPGDSISAIVDQLQKTVSDPLIKFKCHPTPV